VAPPKGTTESAPGTVAEAAARACDAFREVGSVTAAPEVARSWTPAIVTAVRTSTAAASGSPTTRDAREPLIRRMDDHCIPALQRGTPRSKTGVSEKYRDQCDGADVIRVMLVPNSRSVAWSPE